MTLAMVFDMFAYLKVADRKARIPAVDRHYTNLLFKQRSLFFTRWALRIPAAVLILCVVNISTILGIS